MKIVTYNINGIRASFKQGLAKWLKDFNADVYCFQEVRCSEELARQELYQNKKQLDFFGTNLDECDLSNYISFFNCGEIAGYAGTLILTKNKPDKIIYDMQEFWSDNEGRTTTAIFGNIAIVNAYIPNGNSRLDFKLKYLDALTKFIEKLNKIYIVICVGDFNIAHNEIDLTNPKECKNKSVFLPIERQIFSDILSVGMVDSFRYLHPEEIKYSWRSYRSMQDTSYSSWKYRIDYIIVNYSAKENIKYSDILDLPYSDHLPVVIEYQI